MKLPNEGTFIFLVPASNHFMFWCRSCDERMYLWWILIKRHTIWYVHMNIYMRINMLHIINFPFAHRVTEFLISPLHRIQHSSSSPLLLALHHCRPITGGDDANGHIWALSLCRHAPPYPHASRSFERNVRVLDDASLLAVPCARRR